MVSETSGSSVPSAAPASTSHRSRLLPLTLTALGVVYGDIGTSPLYAMRECFFGSHSVPPTHDNVLGVLSLIIWSLLLVVSVKYVALVLRADNQGEGGILALTALVPNRGAADREAGSRLAVGRPVLIALGIFGTALLYGDGMITPAISVLGAVEGLEVATPLFTPVRRADHRGDPDRRCLRFSDSARIGSAAVRADRDRLVRGDRRARRHRGSARARSAGARSIPGTPCAFFQLNGFMGFAVLGSVFLVVTGGEALYADMGHFGRRPIRLAWFALVLPALVLNYLGQGALLLANPAAEHPFFELAPSWALLPLVVHRHGGGDHRVAGADLRGRSRSPARRCSSAWRRASTIEHTSAREMGQIYVPRVNWALMVATVAIVIGFGSLERASPRPTASP